MPNSTEKFNAQTTLVLGFVLLLTYNDLLQGGSWMTGVVVFVAIYATAVYVNRLNTTQSKDSRRYRQHHMTRKPTDRNHRQHHD